MRHPVLPGSPEAHPVLILHWCLGVIDTHCHLDVAGVRRRSRRGDRACASRRASTGMLVPAIRPRTWPALRALARAGAACGSRSASIRRSCRSSTPTSVAATLDAIARAATEAGARARSASAGSTAAPASASCRSRCFRAHIRAARALGLPLVDPRPARARRRRRGSCARSARTRSAACCTATRAAPTLVPVYRDLGLAFSFAGPGDLPERAQAVEAARAVPDELLLAETDAPDQAPARIAAAAASRPSSPR